MHELQLRSALVKVAGELGYERPTRIQALAIPPLLAGRDVIGKSKTGSGKTAAFVLPMLQRLDLERRDLQALVLCPTRELAAQVRGEVRTLGRGLPGLVTAEPVVIFAAFLVSFLSPPTAESTPGTAAPDDFFSFSTRQARTLAPRREVRAVRTVASWGTDRMPSLRPWISGWP